MINIHFVFFSNVTKRKLINIVYKIKIEQYLLPSI